MIRVFRHYIPSWIVALCLLEAVLLFAAVYLGATVRLGAFNPSDKLIVGSLWPRALFWSSTMCILLVGVGLYQPDLRDDLRGIWFRLLVAVLVGALVTAAALAIAPRWSVAPGGLSIIIAISVVSIGGIRSLLHVCSDSDFSRRRILVLGSGEAACEVEKLRRKADWRGLSLLGFLKMEGEPVCVSSRMVFPHDAELAEICARMKVDELVIALDEKSINVPVNEVLDCKVRGVQVTDLIGFFEQRTGKIMVDSLKPSQVIFADGFVQAALKSSMHRVFDITVSSLMLLSLSWLILLTALFIRLESKAGEKILYRQTRVGRDNQLFEILKFRSMTSDAEKNGAQWATEDDERITRVGAVIRKTRIDELPQLVNVIKGEMSFVGPRPERPEFVEKLNQSIPYYNLRHRVNPGITGWAQICYPYGASEADAKEKLQFDLYYIKNYSLFLDIMILLQTVQVILWGKGAR